MPIATPDKYAEMIDRAKAGGFAYPAVNVTSSQTLNATLQGFADAGTDGIIQVSTGGGAYWSGAGVKDMVAGSLGFAAFAHEAAKNYPINVALHTTCGMARTRLLKRTCALAGNCWPARTLRR